MKKILFLLFLILQVQLFAQSNYAVIGASDVKMRSMMSTNAEIVSLLQLGDIAKILDESTDYVSVSGIAKSYKWFKININGKTGWVFGAFVFRAEDKLKNIFNSDMDEFLVGKFYNSTNDCNFGDCTENFMAVIPGNFTKAKKARMVNFKGNLTYRGMFSFTMFSMVSQGFVKNNGNIALVMDNTSMIGGELQMLELRWNGSSYTAVELCKISD